MVERGTFPEGVIVDNALYSAFELHEELFRHTFEVTNDPDLDEKMLADEGYFMAAILARRLQIIGLDRRTPKQKKDGAPVKCLLTPDEVLNLSGTDGRAIQMASARIELRREAFRKKIARAPDGSAADDETGVLGDGNPG